MPQDDTTPAPARALHHPGCCAPDLCPDQEAHEAAARAKEVARALDAYDPAAPSPEPWWPPEPSDWD